MRLKFHLMRPCETIIQSNESASTNVYHSPQLEGSVLFVFFFAPLSKSCLWYVYVPDGNPEPLIYINKNLKQTSYKVLWCTLCMLPHLLFANSCRFLSQGNDTCASDCEGALSGPAFTGQEKAVCSLTRSKRALLSYEEVNSGIHGKSEAIWLYMTKKRTQQCLETQAGLLYCFLNSKWALLCQKISGKSYGK